MASESTTVIEEKLSQLIDSAQNGQINPDFPSLFLQHTSLALWEKSPAIEPIFYLYRKYYSSAGENMTQIGVGLPYVMGKIAASFTGTDRNTLINATVEIIKEKEEDTWMCLFQIITFAENLSENGANKEAKIIARLLKEMNPDTFDQHSDLKADIEAILMS